MLGILIYQIHILKEEVKSPEPKKHQKSAEISVQEIPEEGRRGRIREEEIRRDFHGRNGGERKQEGVRNKGIPRVFTRSKRSGKGNSDVFQS